MRRACPHGSPEVTPTSFAVGHGAPAWLVDQRRNPLATWSILVVSSAWRPAASGAGEESGASACTAFVATEGGAVSVGPGADARAGLLGVCLRVTVFPTIRT